jgi:hypothetical protein
MDSLSHLPRLEQEDLIDTWDESRNACCGYLNKKAGKASTFSTGKWQKRWFVLKIQLSGHDNYALSYYHSPEEKNPRQSFKLDGASLTITSGKNAANSFQLICSDGTHVMIGCDSKETMNKWILSLETAIRVAGERGKVQRERWGAGTGGSIGMPSQMSGGQTITSEPLEDNVSQDELEHKDDSTPSQIRQSMHQSTHNTPLNLHHNTPQNPRPSIDSDSQLKPNFVASNGGTEDDFANPFSTASSTTPALRLDADINTIPPGSTQRNEFEEMFRNDIARTLGIDVGLVGVLNIRPSPGMDWLTIVEFDIFIEVSNLGLSEFELEEMEDDEDLQAEAEMQCRQKHTELLANLFAFVKDGSSPLYNGFITCNVDPSFSHGLQATMIENDDNFEIFSAVPEVLNILQKYKNVKVPSYVPNLSHFKIYLSFEGVTRPIMVPNPLILSKNKCFIWPFEVKRGIGMMDNMQELWIEPTALVPVGLPKSLSDPIFFAPSARCDGNVVIHAAKLKADLCYNVICEDNRLAVLNMLSEEEKEIIRETFDSYDKDGNGTISKLELDDLVRKRTAERKELIDKQFAAILEENNSDETFLRAEESRRMQFQQLGEAQNKLVRMFENCDINGDGQVNFSEFLLAEAWWLRCTINPEHASLF